MPLPFQVMILKVFFPAILGREGAGVVVEVGEGVTSVKPGDHVILSIQQNVANAYFVNQAKRISV